MEENTVLTVRKAGTGDVPFIAAAEKRVFSDPWSEKSIVTPWTANYGTGYIAEQGGVPVGYLLAGGVPPESELYRVAVLPEYRGRGVGRALVDFYLADSKREHLYVFFLEVRASNVRAISLYRKAGYTENGKRKNYYKDPAEDAILMYLSAEKEVLYADSGV